MEERTTQACEILFTQRKDCGVAITTFMADYEKGSRVALKSVYGNGVQIKRCLFHYTQAVMKRVKKVGLQSSYANVPVVNKTVRRLFALAFVQAWEVEEAVQLIEDDAADSQSGAVA